MEFSLNRLKRVLRSGSFQNFAFLSSSALFFVELLKNQPSWLGFIFSSFGVCTAFYLCVSRYLIGVDLDLKNRGEAPAERPGKRRSEIQLLLEQQNQLLAEISQYQDSVANKIDEAKTELLEVARQQLVTEISGSLVHDLRNPLASIMSYLDFLKEALMADKVDKKTALQCIEKLSFALAWMNRLVDRMTKLCEYDQSSETQIHIQDVIHTVSRLLERKLVSQRVELHASFSPDFPQIQGNVGQVEQLFLNLIANAIDALGTSSQRVVEVSGDFSDEAITINVRDRGVGIPDENLESLFKPFFTTKQKGLGTGLGLSIAHQIAHRHGGDIQIKSRLGEGTLVSVRLPVLKRESAAA